MEKAEVELAVNKIIADNSLDAAIVECDTDYEDSSHWRVEVAVARSDYDKALMLDIIYCDEYSVRWRQRTPPLVPAQLGDLVLLFSECSSADEDSDVGLVSTVFKDEKGEVCYGCRYIRIGLNDNFVDRHYDFEISEENYGGYPTGFLKILTPEEAKQHLDRQLDEAFEKEKLAVEAKYNNSKKQLPGLIEALQKFEKMTCEKLNVEEYLPFSCKVGR